MPYCFDFTFNFLYLVNVFEQKKKKITTRRRKEMGRRGKMWQESRFVPPVGAAGGVCPAGGGLWVCLAHGQGDRVWSQPRDGDLGSGLLTVWVKWVPRCCQAPVLLPALCVHPLDSCAPHSPCEQH